MNLVEALEKSDYAINPNLNGILAAVGDWGTFKRIYMNEQHVEYVSSELELTPDLVRSYEWEPVSFRVQCEVIKE